MEQTVLTQEGFESLKLELGALLKDKRPALIEDIKKAQEDNNCAITENSEFIDASTALDRVENKINEIETKLRKARVINLKDIIDDGKIKFGTTVELLNLETEEELVFKIVGVEESDIKAKKISFLSPLAKEMMGMREGDIVDCAEREYEILSVKVII